MEQDRKPEQSREPYEEQKPTRYHDRNSASTFGWEISELGGWSQTIIAPLTWDGISESLSIQGWKALLRFQAKNQ